MEPARRQGTNLLGRRYLLQCRIGRGGSAAVYRAWDRLLGRHVAVKLPSLRPEHGLWRSVHLLREIAAVGPLKHPTLAHLLDWGVVGDTPFLTYEYLAGGSLAERLRAAPLSIAALVRTLVWVAGGLAVLHQRGWVHGDVKPENVLFDELGRPRLSDFGLARVIGEPSCEGGVVLASPHFASQEQRAGEPLTPASDTYALCAVLYSGLTGKPVPRFQWSARHRSAALLRELRQIHPDAARRFGALLIRGLSSRAQHRFADGELLAGHLRHCLSEPISGVCALTTPPATTIGTVTAAHGRR